MMTRKATAKDMEMKLKQSLSDLKASRDLNDRLMQEREESELEIVKILEKNQELKRDMAKLHDKYMDLQEQCNVLQDNINSFNACSNTHEQALSRINFLEVSLSEAHNNMKQLEIQLNKDNIDTHSQSLLSELTECNSALVTDNLIRQNSNFAYTTSQLQICSVKKLKKYIRVSKFIKKGKRLIKQQNYFVKHLKLRKERRYLIEKLKELKNCSLNNSSNYNNMSINLETKIENLEQTMKTMLKNIQSMSQKQLHYQIRATSDMEDMCNYNAERFESLNMKRSCKCAIDSVCYNKGKAECLISEQQSVIAPEILSEDNNSQYLALPSDTQFPLHDQLETLNCNKTLPIAEICNTEMKVHKTLLFSDQIGVGISSIINNHTDHTVFNYCMPEAPLSQIIDHICSSKMDENTNIILFIGNSNKINVREIKNSFTKLNNIKCNQVTWCALPYSVSLNSHENDRIFALNRLIHHLISRHSDTFSWFDSNLFIKHFEMTKNYIFLAKRCKHNVATLLANIINLNFNKLVTNRLSTGAKASNYFLVK
jgi:hypothetical protein